MVDKNLIVPDDAIAYIVRNYLAQRRTEGLPVAVGVSQNVVQTVLDLFVAWAKEAKRVQDNTIVLGE